MQVAELTESRKVAREKYLEYLHALKDKHSAEYVAAKNAYRELSKGNTVIDLFNTMQNAGLDEQKRPKLAIVRADAKLCYFRWGYTVRSSGREPRPIFSSTGRTWWDAPKVSESVILPQNVFGVENKFTDKILRAVVPTIPPALNPGGDLSKYRILWEAEWETIPVDPILLKPLGKSLYVVLAQWDLTPVEQAVLRDAQL